MKIEFKTNYIPVLGWLDITAGVFYEDLANEVCNSGDVIFSRNTHFDDGELCTIIFYKDYSKKRFYQVMTGTVMFLGLYPDPSAMMAYSFDPVKNIKVKRIEYCEHCGVPEVVILKTKKL